MAQLVGSVVAEQQLQRSTGGGSLTPGGWRPALNAARPPGHRRRRRRGAQPLSVEWWLRVAEPGRSTVAGLLNPIGEPRKEKKRKNPATHAQADPSTPTR